MSVVALVKYFFTKYVEYFFVIFLKSVPPEKKILARPMALVHQDRYIQTQINKVHELDCFFKDPSD